MKKALKSFFLALIKYIALQLELFYETHVDIDDPSYQIDPLLLHKIQENIK